MNLRQANRKLSTRLAIIAVGMFGFGFLLVPFYYQICEAWGVNAFGETRAAPANTQVDASRTVTIELDSNAHNLPWRFRPLVTLAGEARRAPHDRRCCLDLVRASCRGQQSWRGKRAGAQLRSASRSRSCAGIKLADRGSSRQVWRAGFAGALPAAPRRFARPGGRYALASFPPRDMGLGALKALSARRRR